MDFNAAEPSNQGGAGGRVVSPDPLSSLQGVVDVARQAAGIPAVTPQEQFTDQFGSKQPTTPPVVEISNPTTEVASQPEDPQATFVQEIKNAVDRLEQATKEKVAV